MSLLAHAFDILSTTPATIPDPSPSAPPGFAGPIAIILGWAKWLGLIIAVLGVIIIGAKLAINVRRGEAAGELGGLLYVGLGCILIGAAASLVGFLSGN
jgi:hypothetical protein